jgi:putative transposase
MENSRSIHSVNEMHVHIVWSTKFRYDVLRGDVQIRCREILMQGCDNLDIRILKGVISSNHVQMLISYPPRLSVSNIVKHLKKRSAQLLMEDFTDLKKRFLERHFWEIGYGAWSSGNVTDEIIRAYLEHHKHNLNSDENFILE